MTILDPQTARVDWLRPLDLNGPAEELRYKVLYSHLTDGLEKNNIGYLMPSGDLLRLDFQKEIGDLTGGHQYQFQVSS